MQERYEIIQGHQNFGYKTADLHIHTNESDGYLTPIQVVDLASELNFNAIAITDHNTMLPAIEAWNYNQRKNYSLEVVVGTEIDTNEGHILGLFIPNESQEFIPHRVNGKMLKPGIEEAIEIIHQSGGMVIAPHPGAIGHSSLAFEKGLELYCAGYPLDGFEIFNAGNDFRDYHKSLKGRKIQRANEKAQRFYQKYNAGLGAAVGATDTHFNVIGVGLTGYEGNLKRDIKDKKTTVLKANHTTIIENKKISEKMFGQLATTRKSMLEVQRLSQNPVDRT